MANKIKDGSGHGCWPKDMQMVKDEFKRWCELPYVQGTINGTHIAITKPIGAFATYYYYFKTRDYNIVAQIIVDCNQKFINLYVGLLGLINDSHVIKKSTLYKCMQYRSLLDNYKGTLNAPSPHYLIGDKGYPLISWIMIPFKEEG
jgi:hypothetical protein